MGYCLHYQEDTRMRLHIEGQGTKIVPHLLGRIAERLEQLNQPYEDIFEARLTLAYQGYLHEARVRLLLAGKTLYAVQHGDSPDAAIGAALRCVEGALQERRALRRRTRLPLLPTLPGYANRLTPEATGEPYRSKHTA
jgi:ribosome-associated translation inhibitor RaiA